MASLSNIYFAYKNYIHLDYGVCWDLERELIKKYNIDERRDRITKIDVTNDIEKSNIEIKKGYYSLSFNNSKVSSINQITDFYLQHTGIGCDICFNTGNSFRDYSQISDLNVIVPKEEDIARIDSRVELQKQEPLQQQIEKEIFEKVKSQVSDIRRIVKTELFSLDKDFFLAEGVVVYGGEEEPYFGILLRSEGVLLIEPFKELRHVLLIDGRYYFAAYWQEPECGKRGMIVYRVEKGALIEVFADYSEAT